MSLPALPNASAVTPAQVAEYASALVAWSETVTDPGEVRDVANKWAAITEYLRRTSREGIAEAEGALRRLEMRVGELDTPKQGERTDLSVATEKLHDVSRSVRSDFRKMAEHPEIVEQVIAESTDADPPSRRKVLHAIDVARQAEAELHEELDRRGIRTLTPAEAAAQRPAIECMAFLWGVVDETLAHRKKFGTSTTVGTLAGYRLRADLLADLAEAVAYLSTITASEVAA